MAGSTTGGGSRLGSGGKQAPSRVRAVSALYRYVGKSAVSARTGSRYSVRREGDKLYLDVTPKKGAKKTIKPSDADFQTAAADALEAFAPRSSSSSGSSTTTTAPAAGSSTTTTAPAADTASGTTTTTPSTPATDTTGAAPASSAPDWTKRPLVAEVLAIDGWSGRSPSSSRLSYRVSQKTFDHIPMPVIAVTGPGPTDAPETTEVTPNSTNWEATARTVLDAKAASEGSSSQGSFVPSSESAPSPDASVPDIFMSPRTPADATTVSSTPTTPAPAAQGFVAQYKWWLVGGVAAVAGYALLHRAKPDTFPLPAALSKLVR